MKKLLITIALLFTTTLCFGADKSEVYKNFKCGPLTITQSNGNLTTPGTFEAGAITGTSITDSSLTTTRVLYSINDVLSDSANLTFDNTNLDIGGATNYVRENATGTLYAGTARPRRSFYINSGASFASTTAGVTLAKAETPTYKRNYYYFDFVDQNLFVEFTSPMPKTWDGGTVTAIFYYIPTDGADATRTVIWGIQATCIGDNQSPDLSWGTQVTVTDTVQTVNYEHITSESGAITVAGTLAGEKLVHWRIQRVATDTAVGYVRLLGILIKYTATGETDD